MNRVCCGAVNSFADFPSLKWWVSHRSVLFYKFGGICDRGYHGLLGASRWFCKIYCGKAVIVGLMKSHIGGKFLLLTNKCRVQKQILWQMNKNIENEMLL